jgi:arylformamidase
MKLYDITMPLQAGLAGWPGDAPYQFEWSCTRAGGASVNVGRLSLSVHSGTHTDAPFHFDDHGTTVEALALHPYLGACRVVDVRGKSVISRADLAGLNLAQTPRLLLHTGGWPNPAQFPREIPVLAEDVPAWLREQGAVLVGFDVPSVDALDSKSLPIHHALGRAGIAILESLALDDVPAGVYELIALPLRLVGADGSPVRAILRSLDR